MTGKIAADRIRIISKIGYTTLQNSMIVDKRLSLKTKGLMAVMLSRPEGWDFSVSGLAAFCGCGKDTIRSALKELETAGYLTRQQLHSESGAFAGNFYELSPFSASADGEISPLSENPTTVGEPLSGFPSSGNPSSGNPSSGNPTQRNKDLKKERLKEPPIAPQGGQAAVFLLPLSDGTNYEVTQGELAEWRSLYPRIDVPQQFRSMTAWLAANPERRKTRRGVRRFIVSWLSRRADKLSPETPKEAGFLAELVV